MTDPPFSNNDRVTAADLDNGIPVLLMATTLTAVLANVTLTVPPGYKRLRAYFSGKCAAAVAASNVRIQFNGDTGANYNYIFTQSNNGTTTTADDAAQTAIQVATLAGATSTANYAGSGNFVVDNVGGGGFFPIIVGTATTFVTTTNMYNGIYSGQWSNNAAVTSINFIMGSGNWMIGSAFSLYGLPA